MTRPARLVALVAVTWLGALTLNRSMLRVTGRSMLPTLRPGEVVLVVPARLRRPHPGDVVVVADPREPGRATIKRAIRWTDAGLVVHGDNPAASTDSRVYGPVPADLVRATVLARIGLPPRRLAPR